MDRLTEPQFKNLIALTSVRTDSATHEALYRHLVLGYSKREACESAGISHQAMNTALKRLTTTDEAARRYVESLGKKITL